MDRLKETTYGFEWDGISVERLCSSLKKPKFHVLCITTPDEKKTIITIRPRSITVNGVNIPKTNSGGEG